LRDDFTIAAVTGEADAAPPSASCLIEVEFFGSLLEVVDIDTTNLNGAALGLLQRLRFESP